METLKGMKTAACSALRARIQSTPATPTQTLHVTKEDGQPQNGPEIAGMSGFACAIPPGGVSQYVKSASPVLPP